MTSPEPTREGPSANAAHTAEEPGPAATNRAVILRCRCLALFGALVGLAVSGCGQPPAAEESEDELVIREYLADHPEIQDNHEHWHVDTDRGRRDYGAAFLAFHREVIASHDSWRLEHGYPPLTPWDPSNPIPPAAFHRGRTTSDPSSVDPLCRTPEWLRLDGAGVVRNPEVGAGRLADFTSADQVGRAIDSLAAPNWHGRVHATVGGDLASLHRFVLDPAFWRFHKFIDDIWRQWQDATATIGP